MADVIGLYRRAVEEFGARVRTVSADQWSQPTPDADWDVRALVNHVLNENQWVPPLLEGLTIAEVGDRFEGDQLGADPYAAWTDVAVAALAACQDDDVPLRVVHVSFGDITGEDYLAQVTTDHVIHAWDLARATGGDEHLDPELVDFAYGYLAPQAEMWREAGAFGPAIKVPAGRRPPGRAAGPHRPRPARHRRAGRRAPWPRRRRRELSGERPAAPSDLGLLAGQARTIQAELDSYTDHPQPLLGRPRPRTGPPTSAATTGCIVTMAAMLGYPVPPHPPQGAQRRLSREERAAIQEFLEEQRPRPRPHQAGAGPGRPGRRAGAWGGRSGGGPGRSAPAGGGRPARRPRRRGAG